MLRNVRRLADEEGPVLRSSRPSFCNTDLEKEIEAREGSSNGTDSALGERAHLLSTDSDEYGQFDIDRDFFDDDDIDEEENGFYDEDNNENDYDDSCFFDGIAALDASSLSATAINGNVLPLSVTGLANCDPAADSARSDIDPELEQELFTPLCSTCAPLAVTSQPFPQVHPPLRRLQDPVSAASHTASINTTNTTEGTKGAEVASGSSIVGSSPSLIGVSGECRDCGNPLHRSRSSGVAGIGGASRSVSQIIASSMQRAGAGSTTDVTATLGIARSQSNVSFAEGSTRSRSSSAAVSGGGGGGGLKVGGGPSSQKLQRSVSNASNASSTRQRSARSLARPGTGYYGDLVMRNFRELLWYWQEYYLRRGRDRLSIEFSSHVPFHVWMDIVGE